LRLTDTFVLFLHLGLGSQNKLLYYCYY